MRGGFGGANDWRVSGAAAKVACQHIIVVGAPVCMPCGHRCDEPRRAETALRSVVIDHGLLDWMERAVWRADAFNGAHCFTVELRHEQDAGVERALGIPVCYNNGTSPAVAFIAAFFGACEAAFNPKPIQQSLRGRCVHLHGFPVEKKRHFHTCRPAALPIAYGVCCDQSMRRKLMAPRTCDYESGERIK